MITEKITFEAALGHEELAQIIPSLEDAFKKNLPNVEYFDIVQNSNSSFDVFFKIPKQFESDVKNLLSKQSINMSLFEAGLTGFLI